MKYSVGDKIKTGENVDILEDIQFEVIDILEGPKGPIYNLMAKRNGEDISTFAIPVELIDKDFDLTLSGLLKNL